MTRRHRLTSPVTAVRTRIERFRERGDAGYVAVMTGMLLMVLLGFAAFAVDVGRWYLVGQNAQRAADAGALAGVVSLPGDQVTAFSEAQKYTRINGYTVDATTSVVPAIDGSPTRLRVTITRTVGNMFGALLGVRNTTVSKSAVADYAGPVAMGSPCNVFGNDPDGGSNRGAACDSVGGQLWASVNSPSSDKANGDAFHSQNCSLSILVDGCSGASNDDYDPNGYFYTVSVRKAMSNLTIELFDPVYANTGLTCGTDTDTGAITPGNLTNATKARNNWVSDETTRYAAGSASDYCTGDSAYSGSTPMNTRFSVRPPGSNAWDPLSSAEIGSCTKVYAGYNGTVYNALHEASSSYDSSFAMAFRRWSTLCTISNPVVGDYSIQVRTKNVGADSSNAGNRYSIRVSGGSSSNNNAISISGHERMSIYSNRPGKTTEFYLARVPSGAAGQRLNLQLFDVGDATRAGDIQISPPPDSNVSAFTNCKGVGPTSGTLPTCRLSNVSSLTHNGRLQIVSVPIPTTYSCDDTDPTKCWVRLKYIYGVNNAPTDVTSWTANIEGDPVRLVE